MHRTATANLKTVIGQKAVIKPQGAGVGDEGRIFHGDGLKLRGREHTRHHGVGQDGHDTVAQKRAERLPAIGPGGQPNRSRLHDAARCMKVMAAVPLGPSGHGTRRVNLHAQLPGQPVVPKGQFQRMNTHTLGLKQCAVGLLLLTKFLAQLGARQHARLVTEDLPHHLGLIGQKGHFFLAVGHVEVPVVLSIAVNLGHQTSKRFKARANFRVQTFGRVQAPAPDPLRAVQPAAGVLTLATIAAGAAPGRLIRLQKCRLNAVLTRQKKCRGKSREPAAHDDHIGIGVRRDRAIVFWRGTCGGHPIRWRVGHAPAHGLGHQGVKPRIVRLSGQGRSHKRGRLQGYGTGHGARPSLCETHFSPEFFHHET